MSLRQRDYILRMIEQLAQALGAMAGLRKAGKHDEAAQLWQSTADGLFGPLLSMLEQLDPTSAALLIGDRDKLVAYAALVAERGDLSQARGGQRQAATEHRRALELFLEAVEQGAELQTPLLEIVQKLRSKVDEAVLARRHREALDRLCHP